jgi:hypothetical protein
MSNEQPTPDAIVQLRRAYAGSKALVARSSWGCSRPWRTGRSPVRPEHRRGARDHGEDPWQRHRTVIEIGAAERCVPVQLALMHPQLTGGGFDLPIVRRAFEEYVNTHGRADR